MMLPFHDPTKDGHVEYVDDKIIEGFRVEVSQQLGECVEFATTMLKNEGETDPNELRQAAQDALTELMVPGLVEAVATAYEHSPLGEPDFEAIATIFKRLAIRSKLRALTEQESFPVVTVLTRKGEFEGSLYGIEDHEGARSIHLHNAGEDMWVQVDSIQEIH